MSSIRSVSMSGSGSHDSLRTASGTSAFHGSDSSILFIYYFFFIEYIDSSSGVVGSHAGVEYLLGIFM